MPSHGQRVPAVAHPLPVHAVENAIGQRADFVFSGIVLGKILFGIQNSRQEQSGVDRRKLDGTRPEGGAGGKKMVEPAFVTNYSSRVRSLWPIPEGLQRCQHALPSILAAEPAMV